MQYHLNAQGKNETAMTAKHFLLLQGVATPFFNALGKALMGNGHRVTKLNFCGGDVLLSRDLPCLNINSNITMLSQKVEYILDSKEITDAILFGDCRPIHQAVINALKKKNIKIHVYEEGYFRPHWITLERNGVNGFSHYMKLSASDWLRHSLTLNHTTYYSKLGVNIQTL